MKINHDKEPVSNVMWIDIDLVQANEYNPNKVAGTEMKLLYKSIKEDGYTQPIVVYPIENGKFEIVDGFHRYRVCKEHKDIYERTGGQIPCVVLDKDKSDRMISTVRHNRARGTHGIKAMSEIVAELYKEGKQDYEIAESMGMDAEELIRLKQKTCIPELFKNHVFSKSWKRYKERRNENETD